MSLKNSARERESPDVDDAVSSDPRWRSSGVLARVQRAPSVPPIALREDERPLISIAAPADAALLEPTYAYLSAYSAACLSPQVAQRLNVAIYELYANALRYGRDGGEVRFELTSTPRGAQLVITNHTCAEHRERLAQQIERVRQDPEAAFAREMEHFADGSSIPSMLGIVRVAHEAGIALDCATDGDRVRLTAICEA